MTNFTSICFRFLIFCLCFFLISFAIFIATRSEVQVEPETIFRSLDGQLETGLLGVLTATVPAYLIFTATRWYFGKHIDLVQTLKVTSLCAAGVALMHIGFNLFKNSIPLLVPFFADPVLADIDRVLHGGPDPWAWTWVVFEKFELERWADLYFFPWLMLASLFPLLLLTFDTNPARVSKHFKIYLFCWVFLGCVVATAVSSVGPVFYDRLLGTLRFADLLQKQATFNVDETSIGKAQDFLWSAYVLNKQELGSGISAFPSVHVALATLFALYAWERSKLLFLIGLGYWIVILFFSVWSGFHYAVDGYFSTVLVWMYWYYLTCAERILPMQAPGRRSLLRRPFSAGRAVQRKRASSERGPRAKVP